jgi:hypothetical protein
MRRPNSVKLVLDFQSRQIRACLYVSEVKAQEMAVRLRRHAHAGGMLPLLRPLVERGLLVSMQRGGRGLLKILHQRVPPALIRGGALKRVPPFLLDRLRVALQTWVTKGVLDSLKNGGPSFIRAAEAPADGVTFKVTISGAPGLDAIGQALTGRPHAAANLNLSDTAPLVKVDIAPGYQHV